MNGLIIFLIIFVIIIILALIGVAIWYYYDKKKKEPPTTNGSTGLTGSFMSLIPVTPSNAGPTGFGVISNASNSSTWQISNAIQQGRLTLATSNSSTNCNQYRFAAGQNNTLIWKGDDRSILSFFPTSGSTVTLIDPTNITSTTDTAFRYDSTNLTWCSVNTINLCVKHVTGTLLMEPIPSNFSTLPSTDATKLSFQWNNSSLPTSTIPCIQ